MTVRSMTGFGSARVLQDGKDYLCEIKTLNSKFIDINIKLPKYLAFLEPQMIAKIRQTLLRGKIELYIEVKFSDPATVLPQINLNALNHYLDQIANIRPKAEAPYHNMTVSVTDLLHLEGVLDTDRSRMEAKAKEECAEGVMASLSRALEEVIKSREQEGNSLTADLNNNLAELGRNTVEIDSNRQRISSQLFNNYQRRIDRVLTELGKNGKVSGDSVKEERILAEVAIITEKLDITEELARLGAHQKEFERLLKVGINVGRKLDFLCQEVLREINTISSKVGDIDVVKCILSMKQAVDRLRQQIQNIE